MKNDYKAISILLIDDDEDDGYLFGHALHEIDKDITYIYRRDCEKALKELKSFTLNPDFIFLDLNMPKMNGIDALKEVKKVKRLWHIPIIIYSTTKNQDHIDQVMALGATAFITKANSTAETQNSIIAVLKAG